MIRLVAALALAAAAPTAALAQSDSPPTKVKFYVFPEHVLEGGILKPSAQRIHADERPEHARLLKLKHNVLPKLRATRHAGALR